MRLSFLGGPFTIWKLKLEYQRQDHQKGTGNPRITDLWLSRAVIPGILDEDKEARSSLGSKCDSFISCQPPAICEDQCEAWDYGLVSHCGTSEWGRTKE